ncbi:hypothetical protein CW304_17210 [Bacillus sp. UFRGS-B20]|nr:hypothetical protein CW304_17210 [Bacillus sp. UFRGS-B20]
MSKLAIYSAYGERSTFPFHYILVYPVVDIAYSTIGKSFRKGALLSKYKFSKTLQSPVGFSRPINLHAFHDRWESNCTNKHIL